MDTRYTVQAPHGKASVQVVQLALEQLLDQHQLKLSDRNKRFLRFVVAEALAGRGGRIKAYTIGVDVFGRGESFDPVNDPIVRIEATRIRAALSSYYDKFGKREPVKILIPPGSYVPTFEVDDPQDDFGLGAAHGEGGETGAASTPAEYWATIVITVKTASAGRLKDLLTEYLKQSVAARLRRMRLRVFIAPSAGRRRASDAIEKLTRRSAPVYALDGAFFAGADDHLQSWSLTDFATGELLNATSETRLKTGLVSVETITAAIDKVASMIERTLPVARLRAEEPIELLR